MRSAEDGLLVSLDHEVRVDLAYIATLYGMAEIQIVDELGDLVYHDPATSQWETAKAYLSGEARTKLGRAPAGGT